MVSWLHGIAVHHVLRTGTLLTVCCLAGVEARAQSFDCNKASTPVERAICDDKVLGNLDQVLARELRRVLDAEPNSRRSLLADQRRWLAYRDKRCDDASTRNGCISQVYRKRVEHLQSRLVPAAAICHRLAEKDPPIGIFQGGMDLPSFGNPVAELPEWAKRQNPPLIVEPELIDALQEINAGTIGHLHHLPGTNLYAITHEQGSAHCYVSQFFAVEAGRARPVATPPMIEGDGGMSCGASRGYGRLDGMPAIMQTGSDFGPSMSSVTIVVLWDAEMIPSACVMTSWYSPQFGKTTTYEAKEQCEGPMCDGLRVGALELVEAVQKSPRQTHERLHASLTPAQRLEFDAALDQAIARRRLVPDARHPAFWEPEYIAIGVPLFLPYLHAGNVYVASVGHLTAYGNMFADWGVEFESFRNGEAVQFASFPVGMTKGKLEDVSIATKLH
jgi:uncharacterized protein YecT (DUF1311 family)